jgi:hypothetical protein
MAEEKVKKDAATEDPKAKKAKKDKPEDELKEKDLEKVSGGDKYVMCMSKTKQ